MSWLSRRSFVGRLLSLPLLAFAPGRDARAGRPSATVAMLRVDGLSEPRPGVLQGLLDDVEENSSVRLTMADGSIRLEDPRLFRMPFVVLSGASAFAPLSDAALANLRLFLRDGGFLFIDDASGRDSSDFDRCVRRDLKRALPGSPLVPIGRDHAVYRSFFLLGAVSGRVMIRPHLEGVWQGDITPVLYSRNDLFGALWRSPGGGYALDVVPGRERQRGQALRLAINVVLFALTGNYKRDAVHVRALLERMRRQGGYSR